MKVRLISKTQIEPGIIETDTIEGLLAYAARVSSPKQENPKYAKLLDYCVKHNHWSVFEMADMCVEITTSRAIAQQILRHRSFCFQEFSQRYAQCTAFESIEARRQDRKNRQNSFNDLPEDTKEWFATSIKEVESKAYKLYQDALLMGVAKESARFILPLSTQSKLYMKGSLRSWIHYINVRTDPSTQKEHRDIAEACKSIFIKEFPIISEALEWI